jgi:hypothetical protein
MADYDIDGLRDGIEQCRKNIKTFEEAIENERQTIATYRDHIAVLERKKILSQGLVIDANTVD